MPESACLLPGHTGRGYRGRLAPSPTGFLHLGHAWTFRVARDRCRAAGGTLVFRNDDLDAVRSRPEYVAAMYEDLRWAGFEWQEGPDIGGPFGPYNQSERRHWYREALARLQAGGHVYPCCCSRRDILASVAAPHGEDEEPVYPGTCRPRTGANPAGGGGGSDASRSRQPNWRFRVPDGQTVAFQDGRSGRHEAVAGRDFGDFVVWRADGVPAYQLATVVDDALMGITEVVRGEDLLLSTARQVLLFRALGWRVPEFFHCALVRDAAGRRLAKRHDSLALRSLRAGGMAPEALWSAGSDSPVALDGPGAGGWHPS